MLKNAWIYIRGAFPVNRVMSYLQIPITLASGTAAVWIAENAPYLADAGLDETQLTAIAIGGATAGLLAVRQWIDGKLKWDLAEQEQLKKTGEYKQLEKVLKQVLEERTPSPEPVSESAAAKKPRKRGA